MQEKLKVALIQFEPHGVEGKQKNVDFIVHNILELGRQGYQIIVFPELGVSGFFRHEPGGKLVYWEKGAEDLSGPSCMRIAQAAQEVGVYVIFGLAERLQRPVEMYNSAVLVGPKGLIGSTRKIHLPQYEKFYFTSGLPGEVFNTEIGRIGLVVCYDLFFPEIPRMLAVKGAEIIVAISSVWKGGAFGGIGLHESKERFFALLPVIRAMENQVYLLSCNSCGYHDMGPTLGKWQRIGKSKVVDPQGFVIGEAPSDEQYVVTAELSREVLLSGRTAYTFLADRVPHMYTDLAQN